MLSFRQKVLISYLTICVFFIAISYPLATYLLDQIVTKALEEEANALIAYIQKGQQGENIVDRLKEQKGFVFFRVSIIDSEHHVLYDSHAKRLLGDEFSPEYIAIHPEVKNAFATGTGYSEDFSELFGLKFVYLAKAFSYEGKSYVLRTAFPYKYVVQLVQEFEIGMLTLSGLILLLFSLLSWLSFHYFTRPIQEILLAIEPYASGKENELPVILLSKTSSQDDFGKLVSVLNSLSNKVRHQLEKNKDFVANASHELKTPITIIRGFAETLHDHPELPKAVVTEITGKIVSNCQRMTALIQDMLILASLDNLPRSRLVECDLKKLLEKCKEALLAIYPDAEVTISSPNIILTADPALLENALTNLLDNAAKYSQPPAKIIIRSESTGNEVRISVQDQGLGIQKEDLEHIFERFYMVNKSRSKKAGSTGLGLSIVQSIIQKHGGRVFVESEPGKGSTFTCQLPNHPD